MEEERGACATIVTRLLYNPWISLPSSPHHAPGGNTDGLELYSRLPGLILLHRV
jgi:hypothetical protein